MYGIAEVQYTKIIPVPCKFYKFSVVSKVSRHLPQLTHFTEVMAADKKSEEKYRLAPEFRLSRAIFKPQVTIRKVNISMTVQD